MDMKINKSIEIFLIYTEINLFCKISFNVIVNFKVINIKTLKITII